MKKLRFQAGRKVNRKIGRLLSASFAAVIAAGSMPFSVFSESFVPEAEMTESDVQMTEFYEEPAADEQYEDAQYEEAYDAGGVTLLGEGDSDILYHIDIKCPQGDHLNENSSLQTIETGYVAEGDYYIGIQKNNTLHAELILGSADVKRQIYDVVFKQNSDNISITGFGQTKLKKEVLEDGVRTKVSFDLQLTDDVVAYANADNRLELHIVTHNSDNYFNVTVNYDASMGELKFSRNESSFLGKPDAYKLCLNDDESHHSDVISVRKNQPDRDIPSIAMVTIPGMRVEKVETIIPTGVPAVNNDQNGSASKEQLAKYSLKYQKDTDNTINVTFAKNRYRIVPVEKPEDCPEGGEFQCRDEARFQSGWRYFDWETVPVCRIYEKDGYMLSAVWACSNADLIPYDLQSKQVPKTEEFVVPTANIVPTTDALGQPCYEVTFNSDKKSDVYFCAKFESTLNAEESDFTWNKEDACLISDNPETYTFYKTTAVTFKPTNPGDKIRVNYTLGNQISISTSGDEYSSTAVLPSDKASEITLKSVELYSETSMGVWKWHTYRFDLDGRVVKVAYYKGPDAEIVQQNPISQDLKQKGVDSYSTDVDFVLKASAPLGYPNPAFLRYWIGVYDEVTDSFVTSYECEDLIPIPETGFVEVSVPVAEYSGKEVKLSVEAYDERGEHGPVKNSAILKMNNIIPYYNVVVSGQKQPEAAAGCYNTARTAVVTVEGGELNDDIVHTFKIERRDFGTSEDDFVVLNNAKLEEMISWELDSKNKGKATIHFDEDGIYRWQFSYRSKSNVMGQQAVDEEGLPLPITSTDIYEFSIDRVMPTAELINMPGEQKLLDSLFNLITFNQFSDESFEATISSGDEGSGVGSVYWYKRVFTSDMEKAEIQEETLNFSGLQALFRSEDNPFAEYSGEPIEIDVNEKCVLYARVVDNAGNVVYVSSDGVITDNHAPDIVQVKPLQSATVHNKTVVFSVNVNEISGNMDETDAYSGIKKIRYEVKHGDQLISERTLYEWDENTKTLQQQWNKNIALVPFAEDDHRPGHQPDFRTYTGDEYPVSIDYNPAFDQGGLKLIVYAIDNAGIESHKEQSLSINTEPAKYDMLLIDSNNKENRLQVGSSETFTVRTDFVAKNAVMYVKVTDRVDTFDAYAFTNALLGVDGEERKPIFKGERLTDAAGTRYEAAENECLYTVDDWNDLTEDEKQMLTQIGWYEDNENVHFTKIVFKYSGVYSWAQDSMYINKAESQTPIAANGTQFILDNIAPVCQVTIGPNVWDDLLSVLTFGLFTKDQFDVTAEAEDLTSEPRLKYWLYDGTEAKTQEQLDALPAESWSDYAPDTTLSLNVSGDSAARYTIYFRVEDQAGNYRYVCSDGHIIDHEAPAIDITMPGEQPGGHIPVYSYNAEYIRGIQIPINVKESGNPSAIYSGLHLVKYSVMDRNGIIVQDWETIFSWENERETTEDGKNTNGGKMTDKDGNIVSGKVPKYTDLEREFQKTIVLDPQQLNRSDLKLVVFAEDNAGMTRTEERLLDIDITPPQLEVVFDNNEVTNGKYFNHERTATIIVKERREHFDQALLERTIEAKNVAGETVPDSFRTLGWLDPGLASGVNHDQDTYQLRILFPGDANYTFSVKCADKAGNVTTRADSNSQAPWEFTVDKTAPTGTVTAVTAEGRNETWEGLIDQLHFGIWSASGIRVSGSSKDETSPIASVEYYCNTSGQATDATTALTAEQLGRISGWRQFSELNLVPNTQCTVYVKLTDMAGNVTYLSTDGLIVDNMQPHEEFVAPNIRITPEQTESGIYNGDVEVSVHVDDPLVGGTYSGLRRVSFRVLNMGALTQDAILYDFTDPNPVQSSLQQNFDTLVRISSMLNNSNDVVFEVYAEDNAGNSITQQISMMIDVTAPEINVNYTNNTATNDLFNAPRTANITITERNFSENYVHVIVNGAERTGLGWVRGGGTGNGDNTTWSTSVAFTADGEYTFDINCTDLASNRNAAVNYGNSVSPNAFTIDATKPVVKVDFVEGENPHNDQYYQNARVAEISIDDVHFSDQGTKISILMDGRAIENKDAWTVGANTTKHVKRIKFDQEASYTFSVSSTDAAGNVGESLQFAFVVDETDPTLKLKVNDAERRGAYRDEIIASIELSDRNFDAEQYDIKLNGQHVDVAKLKVDESGTGFAMTSESDKDIFWKGSMTDTDENNVKGKVLALENFPTGSSMKEFDDIYTFEVSVTDKAGRTTEKTLVFSVNRFGSTYDISEVEDILGTYTKTPIDVKVSEVNPDYLKNYSVTLFKNNETITLHEGDGFEIEKVGEDDQWHEYSYTIGKGNFVDDGIYSITLHSEDRAGNVNENTLDTKESEISFGIDRTPPKVTLINLEDDETYAEDSKEVLLRADDNLLLTSVAVYLDDMDQPLQEWNEEEIDKIHAKENEDDRVFRFNIPGDSTHAHTLSVVCKDAANNPTEITVDNFYVTMDLLIRFFNNKGLFFGSICGFIAVLIGLVLLTIRKRHYAK